MLDLLRRIVPVSAAATLLLHCTPAPTPAPEEPGSGQEEDRAFAAHAEAPAAEPTADERAAARPATAPERLDDPRQAQVTVPSTWAARDDWPLVLMLHGYGGTAAGHLQWLQLEGLAEELGFVLVAPDGTPDRRQRRFWDAGNSCCAFDQRVDDLAYIRLLVERAAENLRVNRERVYVVGHSNGGFMGWSLACHAPDLVAGVVSIAGAAPATPAGECAEGWQDVAVLQIHGTADEIVHPEGGVVFRDQARPYPGARASLQAWADAAGCGRREVESQPIDADWQIAGAETQVTTWPDCAAYRAMWMVDGAAHLPHVEGEGLRMGLAALMAGRD